MACRERDMLIKDKTLFFLGGCTIAWGIGFLRYLERWVFFPAFPNLLDVLGLIFVGSYLIVKSLDKRRSTTASDASRT